jgi:hypothetical protein
MANWLTLEGQTPVLTLTMFPSVVAVAATRVCRATVPSSAGSRR